MLVVIVLGFCQVGCGGVVVLYVCTCTSFRRLDTEVRRWENKR